ncbi:hypothetical protein R1flu_023636 [Riccia fluitans]|uniref:Uncharacterized protein n=1 Tax=Riccia fluitans TaxID=41844 RepID=A0ABD1XSL1_9MARC
MGTTRIATTSRLHSTAATTKGMVTLCSRSENCAGVVTDRLNARGTPRWGVTDLRKGPAQVRLRAIIRGGSELLNARQGNWLGIYTPAGAQFTHCAIGDGQPPNDLAVCGLLCVRFMITLGGKED